MIPKVVVWVPRVLSYVVADEVQLRVIREVQKGVAAK